MAETIVYTPWRVKKGLFKKIIKKKRLRTWVDALPFLVLYKSVQKA